MDYFYDYFIEVENDVSNLAETGVPENTLMCGVKKEFLQGYVPYLTPFYALLICRYTTWLPNEDEHFTIVKKDPTQRTQFALSNTLALYTELLNAENTDYSNSPDDILLLAETQNDYWYIWIDSDPEDCSIGRFEKGTSPREEVIQSLLEIEEERQIEDSLEEKEDAQYVVLPIPKGHITL